MWTCSNYYCHRMFCIPCPTVASANKSKALTRQENIRVWLLFPFLHSAPELHTQTAGDRPGLSSQGLCLSLSLPLYFHHSFSLLLSPPFLSPSISLSLSLSLSLPLLLPPPLPSPPISLSLSLSLSLTLLCPGSESCSPFIYLSPSLSLSLSLPWSHTHLGVRPEGRGSECVCSRVRVSVLCPVAGAGPCGSADSRCEPRCTPVLSRLRLLGWRPRRRPTGRLDGVLTRSGTTPTGSSRTTPS